MAAMLCLGECKAQFFNNMHRYHIFDINGGNNPSQVMIIKIKQSIRWQVWFISAL